MMQVKKYITSFIILFFINLGLLLTINNNQVIAMNNNNDNVSENNSAVDNNVDEYSVFRNLLLTQSERAQQMINALFNHVAETEINILSNQLEEIHQQIINYQQKQLNDQERRLRNLNNNITRIQLEREYFALTQEMRLAIDNTPLYASEEQIDNLRNIQTRIDQNQRQINLILNQIQNDQN
ncbi:MAG: SVM family protein [Candidatus Phytoplasma australasiaticum]|nr:SVM family protein [Candidatus Phytoplasma australasiaticum]